MEVLEHYLHICPGSFPNGQFGSCRCLGIPPGSAGAVGGGARIAIENLHRGAEYKLRHYGVWHYLQFGAFADDHHDRNELGAVALQRARERGIEARPRTRFCDR